MNIRRLLMALLVMLGMLIVAGSLWESFAAREKFRAVAWMEQTNYLADVSLRLSVLMAMERGVTAIVLADPDHASAEILAEMAQLRQAFEQQHQHLIQIFRELPSLANEHPLAIAMHEFLIWHGRLDTLRQVVDARLNQTHSSIPLSEQEWIEQSSRHIEILTGVRHASMVALPGNTYTYKPNPVLKEALFTVSEYAGRERAIIGTAIANRRPLSSEEILQLQRYRYIVELGLQRVRNIARNLSTANGVGVITALSELESGFLGRYEELRRQVYAASESQAPYPVSADEWYSEATRGINTMVALSESISANQQYDIEQLRHKAYLDVGMLTLALLLAGIIFLFSVHVIRQRIILPLTRLEHAVHVITAGELEQSLPDFFNDELGELAHTLDVMRQTLLQDISQRDADARELRKFAMALEQSADTVIITDHNRIIEYVNAAFERNRGYHRSQVLGRSADIFKSTLNTQELYRNFQHSLAQGEVFRSIVSNTRSDGEVYFEELTISPVRDNSKTITHYIAHGKDVSERIRAENELRKLSRVIEQNVSSVLITDKDGIIEYVNPQFSRVTGYRSEEVRGHKANMFRSGLTPDTVYRELWKTIRQGNVWKGEIQNRRKNGELYWCMVSISPVCNEEGTITHFVGMQDDISEQKELEEQVNLLAFYDELTKLPNRNLLSKKFALALAHAQKNHSSLALIALDIRGFSLINDSLGHQAGDQVLCTVSQRLSQVARDNDTVARYGNDEFIIILNDIHHPNDVRLVAQRLIDIVAQPIQLDEQELILSLHIGISMMPRDGDELDILLRNAVTALHRATQEINSHYCFYTDELNTEASTRLSLEHALRRALDNNELILYYQPKIEVETGLIIGVEALARWPHPVDGWISPEKFIPVAEETGLIERLGRWALDEACRQNKQWQEAGLVPITVAVNVSAHQLRQGGLLQAVSRTLDQSGLAPQYLQLELTESAVMNTPMKTSEVLQQLKSLGLGLAIDDFGTGYSSLSYLGHFPFDALKIDRSFVSNISSLSEQENIVNMIIAMADSLGLRVIAEGVETEIQAQYLRGRGCDELQGYLYSPALPAEEVERLLRDRVPFKIP